MSIAADPVFNLAGKNAAMGYTALKHIHLLCIVLSGSGFLARGIMMLTGSPLLKRKLVRVLPHIIDTALLASAVAMVVMLGASALAMPWLIAKIVGLLVYIGLGTVALKRGRSKGVRSTAFVLALLTFAYIVSVALSKDPAGFFTTLGA
ncbi:SirB2 family protein [Cognatazoarcus halotolerans]|uniref:SirB2 family protein n=1 Tax=Cognatazoarcus halotolerans TaxID=2686016 RepID=UPI002E0F64A0